MRLFNTADPNKNLLPYDGTVNYYGVVIEQTPQIYQALLAEVEWKNDEAIIFGKHILTKRKVAWYGDRAFEYTYSGILKRAQPWTELLEQLKRQIELVSGETFNSCLLNLYHDGTEGMAWHSDGEKDLKKNGAIASLTFGAERKFSFKHKESKEKIDILLEDGSLLIMKDTTQTYWMHRLPPTKVQHGPRINLTFRTIID
ncbi:alpha-ketoglutarate-dependent dioxygenase AlkB [Sphingobacterium sp. DK4209]|uniref:Alpha-ketoglutarate-dependent dioxygenase AlkB n=1 Tax=Sphingobacterium zhuxiongii TaxID=2662364 RepID=A0A5Q0QHT0_9SPHI|nr:MULTISPECIES: alpha-ketoglutarate-dependent dioxygenase AlkB [unclassified Sphingobacterium]MVZ65470.1 alpha-ketoglutarate-dependent dioxygenase AlkB [Sphingobacterium sp. DK4209]QGA27382.1 alpha-ketoglutarate-dependent dioxygenase AlkB [Sphingobacterium sp. dk4302]